MRVSSRRRSDRLLDTRAGKTGVTSKVTGPTSAPGRDCGRYYRQDRSSDRPSVAPLHPVGYLFVRTASGQAREIKLVRETGMEANGDEKARMLRFVSGLYDEAGGTDDRPVDARLVAQKSLGSDLDAAT